jgi:MFS family permease
MDTDSSQVTTAAGRQGTEAKALEESPRYEGWRVVAVSAVGMAVGPGTLVVYSFAVFLKPLSQEFHWSRSELSWALALMNLVVTFGSPVAGRVTDRFGGRAIVLPSIGLLGVVLLSFYFLSSSLWLLYVLYFLSGLVGLGITPVTYTRIVTTWFDRRRGLALGITTAGIGLGAFIMPLLAQWVITEAGWRWAYVALGLTALLIPLPLMALFLREALRPITEASGPAGSHRHNLPQAPRLTKLKGIRTAVFWKMTIAFFLVAACINGTLTHLPALLTDGGLSPTSAALSLALFGVATFAGRILTGLLVDYLFAPYVVCTFFGGAAVAVSLLATGWMGNSGHWVAMLLGLGVGAEADVMPYLISRYFGIGALGELFGYVFGAYTLGFAIGPLMMAAAFDVTGSYHLPLTLFACTLVLAVFAIVTLPRYSTVE